MGGLFGAVVACGVAAARRPGRGGGEAWRALVSCALAVSAAGGVMVVAPQGFFFAAAIVLALLCVGGAFMLSSARLHGASLAVMVDSLVWMASAMWVFIVFAATGGPIEGDVVPADPIAELALRAELNRPPRGGSVLAV